MARVKEQVPDSPKRDAILTAALELFAERGFHGTAVPLVAARAKVGAGTIYRFWKSKEALVNELYQHWKGELGRTLMADFPLGEPPREQFRELWNRLTAFAKKHPKAIMFLDSHHRGAYLDQKSLETEAMIFVPLRAFILQSQRQQVIKTLPPELLFAMVYGAFQGMVKASWEGSYPLTDEIVRQAENCMWESVRR